MLAMKSNIRVRDVTCKNNKNDKCSSSNPEKFRNVVKSIKNTRSKYEDVKKENIHKIRKEMVGFVSSEYDFLIDVLKDLKRNIDEQDRLDSVNTETKDEVINEKIYERYEDKIDLNSETTEI